MKPFLSFSVERYHGAALVTVVRIDVVENQFKRKVLAQYETLSKGASRSARKEMKKLEKEGALK